MMPPDIFQKSSITADIANCVIKSSLVGINGSIKLAYFNARSIAMDGKFTEFLRLIDGVDFNVICITETWLKPWIASNCISIPGFTLLRNDRESHAGGVAIYIRDCLKWKVVQKSVNEPIEYLLIEVSNSVGNLLVGVIYNPKGGNVSYLERLFSSFISCYEHIIITGDFNINMLQSNPTTTSLKNVLNSQNLVYLPSEQPTRYASLLDLILTADSSMTERFVQLDLSIFDHHFMYLSYRLPCHI